MLMDQPTGPTIEINLEAIADNTRQVVDRCQSQGIGIFGVTKASCGSPLVARAMLKNGVAGLGESRLDNVRRLRRGGITCPIMMLRIPSVAEVNDVVRLCDISLNSERLVVEALSEAAVQQGIVHDVIIMMEMGDRREGAEESEIPTLCNLAIKSPGLRLAGIGANFMCASGVLPSIPKLEKLCETAIEIESRFGIELDYVSGGNSSSLPLMLDEPLPDRINQLRVGASILRGENPLTGGTLDGLRDDTFKLGAELIEIKTKPSLPEGETGRDAFGNTPRFEDRGDRVRGIINLGRVDIRPDGLTALEPNIEIMTASSDHLIVDLTGSKRFAVGDRIDFSMDYGALVQAFLSPYVEKTLVQGEAVDQRPTRLRLYACTEVVNLTQTTDFLYRVERLGIDTATGGETELGDLPFWVCVERENSFEAIQDPSFDDRELGLLWLDSNAGPATVFPSESLAFVGLREASPDQVANIKERNILALTMEDVDLIGIREAMRRALYRVTSMSDGFIMVLDASVGRGMEPDDLEAGLSFRECSTAMELVHLSGGLRALALTGLARGVEPRRLKVAYDYLLSALGKRILS